MTTAGRALPGATAYDDPPATFTFTPVQPFGPGTFVVTVNPGNLRGSETVSYTHLRAHETVLDLVCRLLLEKKKPYTEK